MLDLINNFPNIFVIGFNSGFGSCERQTAVDGIRPVTHGK